MYTGGDALFTVERAIGQVRADEGQLDQTLRSAMEETARLRRAETQGFRTLARIKLDSLMRERVVAGIDATERRALDMIENHRKALEDLAHRRDEAQKKLTEAEAAKHQCDQDLAHVIEALDQLRHHVADSIKSNPNWQAAEEALEDTKKIAENADHKASQAEADLAGKGKPYENDPLFMYLWQKNYGPAEDGSWHLVRYFDQMVARLVGYSDARANYAMLREIPLRLREHAIEKQHDVEGAKDRAAIVERKALVVAGIAPIEAQAEAGNTAVKAAENAVIKITTELQHIEAERQQALGITDDAVYDRATELVAQALTQQDLRRLYQEALQTPGKEDDQAVLSISNARESLQKVDTEVGQIRTQIREMARRRTELEGARDRARTVGYDNPMGNFGGAQDTIGQVIGGILAGALRGKDLDRVLHDNYRHPVPRADPDFGGLWGGTASFPPPWGRPNSWDRDRGSGWRTGGSF